MRMTIPRAFKPVGFLIAMLAALAVPSLFAQDSSAPAPSAPSSSAPSTYPSHPSPVNPRYGGHRQTCWQIAGIPRSVAEQGREIEVNARSQVQGVCSNAALNPQERQQQLRQIHQTERQQLESLVSAQQMEAYRSCRQERGRSANVGGGCGNVTAPQGAENGSMPAQDAPSRE